MTPTSRTASRTAPPLDSPAQLALIGLVVWLVGVLIHPVAILAPIGLILLVLAGVAYLLRPRSSTMYWRGRRIDLDDKPGPVAGLYRAIFKH
jgi:hypothetical protein